MSAGAAMVLVINFNRGSKRKYVLSTFMKMLLPLCTEAPVQALAAIVFMTNTVLRCNPVGCTNFTWLEVKTLVMDKSGEAN